VVLGEVVAFHVNRGVTMTSPTGKMVVDPVKLQPVARLGGATYGLPTFLFDLPRPAADGSYSPNGVPWGKTFGPTRAT
jgi:hypothetical protein